MRRTLRTKYLYTSACINCGRLIEAENAIVKNGRNYCKTCGVHKETNIHSDFNAPEGLLKVLAYILSLAIPFVGFLFGVIFYSQKYNSVARNFGRNCLILMSISLSFFFIIFILSLFFGISVSGGDVFYNIKEGYY